MGQTAGMDTVHATDTRGSAGELARLLQDAGVYLLDGVGWIGVAGEDRIRWLNGMVTNSITELKPGDGNYSFVLNAQGRIQGHLWAFLDESGSLLLEAERDRVAALIAWLERFVIMDDVELVDLSAERVGIGIAGPHAAELLRVVELAGGERRRTKVEWRGAEVEVISAYGPLVPRYELWTDIKAAKAVLSALGGVSAGVESVEWLRILEGTPRYGVDIRERELPQETAQTHALHFAKGCYVGQEIVERIRSQGNVHRRFGAFRLDGPLPEIGAMLEAEGKTVGELTSVAAIPLRAGVVQVGLGYVRREVAKRDAGLRYVTTYGMGIAVPTAVPVRVDEIVPRASGITQD